MKAKGKKVAKKIAKKKAKTADVNGLEQRILELKATVEAQQAEIKGILNALTHIVAKLPEERKQTVQRTISHMAIEANDGEPMHKQDFIDLMREARNRYSGMFGKLPSKCDKGFDTYPESFLPVIKQIVFEFYGPLEETA